MHHGLSRCAAITCISTCIRVLCTVYCLLVSVFGRSSTPSFVFQLGVKQLYRVLEYSLGFFKNNRTRNESEYSFIHGTCIYYRNLQFQGSSRQMVMCRLCGEHLFTSRESPNDPPTNILEKNDCYSVQSGLYHVILKPLVYNF